MDIWIPHKDTLSISVVYFHQLLNAVRTQKLVEILFRGRFNLFCSFMMLVGDFYPKTRKNVQTNCIFSHLLKLVETQTLIDSL